MATNACLDALDKRLRVPRADGEVLWLQPFPDAVLAEVLETTVASVNAALQRARAGVRERLPQPRAQWRPDQDPSDAQRELLARYVEATERSDLEALAGTLHEEVRFSMPPYPGVWEGRDAVVQSWIDGGFGSESFGAMRCVLTRANGRPAVAVSVRTPDDDELRPLALDVLRLEGGLVREIVTFEGRLLERIDL